MNAPINVETILTLDESLEKLHKEIDHQIRNIGKNIVVLIDDIDRLQDKKDLMQIFKLVKLTASFENMLFVLSFDPRYVRKFLEDNADDDISFLDKIIQTPISLPAIDQAKIDRFLLYSEADGSHRSAFDVLFDKLLIDKHRIKEFDDSFVHLYGSQIGHFFYSFPRAKRYLNALYTTLPSVKNEVHLQDFLY